MQLALSVRARCALTQPEAVAAVQAALTQHPHEPGQNETYTRNAETIMELALHPGAPPVQIGIAAGEIRIDAETGITGPGYHAHVADLVATLREKLNLDLSRADDPSGYLEHRDFARLEQWTIGQIERWAKEALGAQADRAIALVRMPSDIVPIGFVAATPACHLLTPLGPRTRQWLEHVAQDGRIGGDAYAWWSGKHGSAAYEHGLGTYLLWNEARFVQPVSEEATLTARRITKAFGVASTASFPTGQPPAIPWPEIAELHELLDEMLLSMRAKKLSEGAKPLRGYRRHEVEVLLPGGVWITLPGHFEEDVDERGSLAVFDHRRAVFASAMRNTDGAAAQLSSAEHAEHALFSGFHNGMMVVAHYEKGDQSDVDRVFARIQAPSSLVMLTFTFDQQSGLPWCEASLASLRPDVAPTL